MPTLKDKGRFGLKRLSIMGNKVSKAEGSDSEPETPDRVPMEAGSARLRHLARGIPPRYPQDHTHSDDTTERERERSRVKSPPRQANSDATTECERQKAEQARRERQEAEEAAASAERRRKREEAEEEAEKERKRAEQEVIRQRITEQRAAAAKRDREKQDALDRECEKKKAENDVTRQRAVAQRAAIEKYQRDHERKVALEKENRAQRERGEPLTPPRRIMEAESGLLPARSPQASPREARSPLNKANLARVKDAGDFISAEEASRPNNDIGDNTRTYLYGMVERDEKDENDRRRKIKEVNEKFAAAKLAAEKLMKKQMLETLPPANADGDIGDMARTYIQGLVSKEQKELNDRLRREKVERANRQLQQGRR